MAYKLLWYKPVYLLSTTRVGQIIALLDEDTDHLIGCWGTAVDGYTFCDFGACTEANLEYSEFEDGYISCLYINNFSNVKTITEVTNSNITNANVSVDLNYIGFGVAASTSGDGYAETASSGTITPSRTRYVNWVRDNGHLLSASESLCVVATDPKVSLNYYSVALIANYLELSIEPSNGNIQVTTQRQEARVRWGDLNSAYCQIIEGEADDSAAGYTDLVDSPGPITAGIVLSDRVVLFKPDSIYELVWAGEPRLFVPSPTVMGNGTEAKHSVKKTGASTCTFWGKEGLYEYAIGGNIRRLSEKIDPVLKTTYSQTNLRSCFVETMQTRTHIWMWMKDVDSVIYKMNFGVYEEDRLNRKHYYHPWFKINYATVIGEDMLFMSKAQDTNGFVPHLFFDEDDAVTLSASDTPGYNKVDLIGYFDRETGYDAITSEFETKDFPLDVDSRVEGLSFQSMCDSIPGVLYLSYSTNEGGTYSSEETIHIHPSPNLEWYDLGFDVTCESIRFKFRTLHPISIGELKMKVSVRKRGQKE